MHTTTTTSTTDAPGPQPRTVRPGRHTRRNVREVERFLDLLTAHDMTAVVDMFADDAQVVAPFSPAGLPPGASGKAMIAEVFTQIFSGYGRSEFQDRRILATTDPDVVSARWLADIDVLASGGRYLSEVVAFFEFSRGHIVHYTEYFNPDQLRAAFGTPA